MKRHTLGLILALLAALAVPSAPLSGLGGTKIFGWVTMRRNPLRTGSARPNGRPEPMVSSNQL